jgi:hypothetical protein
VQRVKLVDATEGGSAAQLPAAVALGDTLANPTTILVGAALLLWNPATGQWERLRTPTVFKTFDLSAGTSETTIWTPTSGKKFRFMGLTLATTTATAALYTFKDNTAGATIFHVRLPSAGMIEGAITLGGNGILSAAANNVLTLTRSASVIATGVLFGTEE